MPADRAESLRLLADALVPLLGGAIPRGRKLALARDLHVDGLDVLANVEHFLADADIRQADESYKQMQESQLRGLIEALQAAAPREALMRFTFLRRQTS